MPPFVGERVWLCNGDVLAKEPGMEDIFGYKVIWAEVSTLLHYFTTSLSSMSVFSLLIFHVQGPCEKY